MSQKKGFTSSDVIICFAMPAFWRAFAILLFSLSSYRELSYHIKKNSRAEKLFRASAWLFYLFS